MKAYADISNALIHLADVATKAHAALEASALQAGARALQVNGYPKNPPSEIVRSLLGIG